MWLGLMLIVICVFALVAGVLSGGIFTIVLVPLAVIFALSALAYFVIARAAGTRELLVKGPGEGESTGEPMPRSDPDPEKSTGRVPTTPDSLVRARQQNQ